MYSRKSVGPRMEPSGTPTLTGYSCEDFPSRTTRSRLLLRKEERRSTYYSFGSRKYTEIDNPHIINATIKYLLDSERFSGPLL